MTQIKVNKRNDYSTTVTFKDDNDVAINITGWTVFFMVKKCYEDDDTDAVISKTVTSHSDPVNGETVITLTDGDTDINVRDYVYDIRVLTDTSDTYTVVVGTFTVGNIVKQGIA